MRLSFRRRKRLEAAVGETEETTSESHANALEIQHLLDGCNEEIFRACELHDTASLLRIMDRKRELRARIPAQQPAADESAEHASELHTLIVQSNTVRDRMLHATNSEELKTLKSEKDAIQQQIYRLLQGRK